MREAVYSPHFKSLTYWDSKNTTTSIDCRTLACAKLVILTQKKLHNIEQTLKIDKR